LAQQHFADHLMAAIQAKHSRVCVGLDPVEDRLPQGVSIERFCKGIIEAVASNATCVKPNAAFFEVLTQGRLNLAWRLAEHAQAQGLLVILDAKRGDIGSTATAYAKAYLREATPFDALTVNPYLGSDGVKPFIEQATANSKGLFVLVKTSNPSSGELQDLELAAGGRVYVHVASLVSQWGQECIGNSGYASVGAVVGATYPQQLQQLRAAMPATPFLVPGYGAQGSNAHDVAGAFDDAGLGAIVNSSRGIIYAYQQPDYPDDFAEAAARAAQEMKDALNNTLGLE